MYKKVQKEKRKFFIRNMFEIIGKINGKLWEIHFGDLIKKVKKNLKKSQKKNCE